MKTSGGGFDYPGKEVRLAQLESESADPDLWNHPEKAQNLLKERSSLQSFITRFKKIKTGLEDAEALIELSDDEELDESMLEELNSELSGTEKLIHEFEFERMLGGEADKNNAIVSINSGAGGTEACDWTSMLLRMLLFYCEKRGWKTSIMSQQMGEEAGVKSATFTVEGEYSYGYLKAEAGVHRLVRISPFDASGRRHTSFASIFIDPEIDDNIDIEIDEGDLRIDTYRASGAGGQHVNKTDSAVRITHMPTGVVVQCQNERSQHKNRATAYKLLRSRLYELELQKKRETIDALNSQKKEIAWGSQIRSYVLHPYRMVKDLRTNVETSNVDAVLNGKLDDFIEAYLIQAGDDADLLTVKN